MTIAPAQPLSLEVFLDLPYLDESPAWEYANGRAAQKPMPKTRHSLLQRRLLSTIDGNSEAYIALPELRCTFGDRSIVPDIAVIAWERSPINDAGEPEDNFLAVPDWTLEILSPGQQTNKVIDNILHCLRYGSQLGWLLDPDDVSILSFKPGQEPQLFRGETRLPVLDTIALELSATAVFDLLKVPKPKPTKG